jgi:uncharacterized protein
MKLLNVSLRHLETRNAVACGEVSSEDLDLEVADELVHLKHPVSIDLEIQRLEDSLLVQGSVIVPLTCDCARCLKSFAFPLELDPYDLFLPLTGEDAVPVENDSVDLTPFLREDILLRFPQHPLCEPDCGGLARKQTDPANQSETTSPTTDEPSSVWSKLNKLKF